MQTFKDPLLTLKKPLLDFNEEEMSAYVARLNINRMKGPARVKRSKATGAPSGGRAVSPVTKLEKILASMGEEERKAFLKSIKVEG